MARRRAHSSCRDLLMWFVLRLKQGVEVGPFCTVGPLARLGRGCKLQTSSHVQGDTVLGDHCTLYT